MIVIQPLLVFLAYFPIMKVYLHTKFHKNLSTGSKVDRGDKQTDRMVIT
jgi:hypothetical protein